MNKPNENIDKNNTENNNHDETPLIDFFRGFRLKHYAIVAGIIGAIFYLGTMVKDTVDYSNLKSEYNMCEERNTELRKLLEEYKKTPNEDILKKQIASVDPLENKSFLGSSNQLKSIITIDKPFNNPADLQISHDDANKLLDFIFQDKVIKGVLCKYFDDGSDEFNSKKDRFIYEIRQGWMTLIDTELLNTKNRRKTKY